MWGQMGEIEGSDATTFLAEGEYAMDKNHVYFGHLPIDGADPRTYKYLGNGYGRDKDNAFFGSDVIYGKSTVEKIDLGTFVFVGDDYAKNKDYVFYLGNILKSADPATFVEASDNYTDDYLKDKNYVFYRGEILENADPATFVLINEYYMKDAKNMFFGGSRIPNVTSKNFTVLQGIYGTDGKHIYVGKIILEKADVATFETTGFASAKDRYATYDGGSRIEN